MMGLTAWTEMVFYTLGSRKSKNSISEKIKACCLIREKKFLGSYLVDGEAVWNNIILKDPDCLRIIKEKNFKDYIALESLYEERCYHDFWSANRSAYKKIKR